MATEGGTTDPDLEQDPESGKQFAADAASPAASAQAWLADGEAFASGPSAPGDKPPGSRPGFAFLQQRLEESGFSFEFFQAVRLLERLYPERDPVGRFTPAKNEVARFAVNQEIGFPASEVEGITFTEGEQPRVFVNFMGLTGPMGVLPLYYSEFLRERARNKDKTAAAFFDIFNHRIISLFYQAWEKYRFPIAYERGDGDKFSHHLFDLIGLGTNGLQRRLPVSDDSLAYFTGLLSPVVKNASNLKNFISDYFGVPCQVHQFVGNWYRLVEETQCQLGGEDTISEQLGLGAIVGDEVYDQQSAVRLVLGPLTLEQYRDFLPKGRSHEALQSLTRIFGGPATDFEVQLILAKDQVPVCRLGERSLDESENEPKNPSQSLEQVQLGWTTWVKTVPRSADATEAVLRF